jgi:hypothetical protein
VTKISQLSSIGDSLAIGDQFLIRDIDDAGSPNKSVTVSGITRALADGNATAPALAFAADKNTGIYRVGTDSLAVATNGTERLRIDNSGGATFKGGSIFIEATSDTNNAQISLGRPSSSSAGYIRYINSENALAFRTNGSGEDVRIDSSGRLGIGTSSPGATLEVAGSARFFGGSGTDGLLTIGSTGASNDAVIIKYDNANDRLQFYNWGASAPNQNTFVIDNANSRVGIGTSAPGSRFTVNRVNSADASATGATTLSNAGITVEATTDTNSRLMFGIGSTGSVPWIQAQNTSSNATQSLILNPVGGNVGIGSTGPQSPFVVSNGGANGIEIRPVESDIIAYNRSGAAWGDLKLNSANNIFQIQGGEVGRFDNSGRLLVGTSSTSATATQILQGNSGAASGNGKLIFARGTTSPANGFGLGEIAFSDSSHSSSVTILAARDGGTWTSGTSQPTRLVFSTTSDSASSPTERLRINSVGQTMVNSAGTAAAPVISKVDDTNTGIFFPAADTIAFAEGGAEAARIDSSGRLLVGTSTSAGNAKFEVTETRRLSATQGGSGWLELTDSAAVTSGTLTDIATVSMTARNTCYFRLEVNAGHTDADGGYSGAVSIREGIITQYGGAPRVLNNTETQNLTGSVNAGVIATAVTTDVVTGTSGATSTVIFRATVTMSGSNSGSTVPQVSYRLSILSNVGNAVTVASNI